MFVVALLRLVTSVDTEAQALAADLGSTAYETRLVIAAGIPAVVLVTADEARAHEIAARIKARTNDAIVCDDSTVLRRSQMIPIRRFAFEVDALAVDVPPARVERVPFDDVLCGLRATHKRQSESTKDVMVTKFSAGRAVVSGGLMMTKGRVEQVTRSSEERELVFYLFRRSGQTPLVLGDAGVQYAGLGPGLAPTQNENALRFIEHMKGLCPYATFDDRLLNARRVPERTVARSKSSETSSADGIDLLAHLLACAIARAPSSPYRG